ncbi:sugar ABC transporter ATP-binding protein [Kosakonia sacchari]|uniref:ABC transporter ATP-binding protein n=1 Tax=Kosakonia sacchari TaxID=1158459 RepID=UPI00080751F2|nr:ABC transporter ATP-binding protein [Kosakonia sacchari]ANR80891.1 sugar ABC transporter ATP-binding protein [Kosakonia sacchari]
MSSDITLKIKNVSKTYNIYTKQSQKLAKFIRDIFGIADSQKTRKFEALKNITFEARKGEAIGILGRNGAGKSTLLQLICGTLTPSDGSIEVNGRLSALLELGAGFNPEFTGRENVYINAAILGLSKQELERKFDGILEFADIGEFIDQPVKNYSSGMFMRLAFAVASSVDPDILIIDEALAVGDVRFQSKCFRRINDLKSNGTTILLVTHSTEQVTRHCDRAVLIEQGEIQAIGDASKVSNRYLELLFGKRGDGSKIIPHTIDYVRKPLSEAVYYNRHEHRWGNGQAQIINLNIFQGECNNPATFNNSEDLLFRFEIEFYAEISNVIVGFTLKTIDGITVFGCNTKSCSNEGILTQVFPGKIIECAFRLKPELCTGDYTISLGVANEFNGEIIPIERRYDSVNIRVESDTKAYGVVDLLRGIDANELNIY